MYIILVLCLCACLFDYSCTHPKIFVFQCELVLDCKISDCWQSVSKVILSANTVGMDIKLTFYLIS